MFKIVLFLLFIGIQLNCFSQDLIQDSRTIDDSTLYYFNNYRYRELVELGEKGIDHRIDFYYLRYRLAIAEQELGRYYRSNDYAIHALKQNSSDPYLYSLIAYNAYMLGKTEEQHFAAVTAEETFDTFNQPFQKDFIFTRAIPQ